MSLSEEEKAGIGVALNEANLISLDFRPERKSIVATFEVICADDEGNIPENRRVQLVFHPIGRIVASLRNGRWDDDKAEVIPFSKDKLLDISQGVGSAPIYGWEFIDCDNKTFNSWKKRKSMEFLTEDEIGFEHTIDLFQEGEKHLDIRIWFDEVQVFNSEGKEIDLHDFIIHGKDGWDSIYAGDRNAQAAFSIIPLKREDND